MSLATHVKYLKVKFFLDPSVRESSAEALGTLMKLVGERAIGPFLVELEKDNLKMSKIKENCEKAVITVKVPGAKKERPTTAPAKVAEVRTVVTRAAAKKQAGNISTKLFILHSLIFFAYHHFLIYIALFFY